jgi:xylulokinase
LVLDVTGTWETVMTTTEQPVLKDDLRRAGMTVQAHVARGRHAVWGGSVAGEMLEWYRREIAHPEQSTPAPGSDWEQLMAEASATPPGARGLLFLPHMSAAACPVVDSHSMGALVGMSGRTTRGDILRAIIEALDYQFLDMVSALESALGRSLDQFVAVGGATRNSFWMQNKADVVGRPLEVPAVEEATPLGAAILAGIGVGLYRDEQEAFQRVYRPGRTYQPDPRRAARYAEWFSVYRDLYPAVRPLHHRLFEEFMT